MIDHPVQIGVRVVFGPLERIATHAHDVRQPQLDERLGPLPHRIGALHRQIEFPVADPHRDDLAIVAEVDDAGSRGFLHLTGQVGNHVVAVEMDVEFLSVHRAAVEELLGHVRIAGGRQQSRKHVDVRHDAVQYRARLDLPRPAHEAGYAPAAFPVGILLAAERGGGAVGPGVVLRSVVGGVHDDGVVGDAQLIELVEHHADLLVVDHHPIAVRVLAALADIFCGDVRAEVHGRRVVPEEERLVRLRLLFHPRHRPVGDLLVDGLHALLGQGSGVVDRLPALAIGLAVEHAARAELLLELGILRVIGQFGFFLGVQVIEIAEEFVEAVHGREKFVAIAEVVLSELAGRVAERLEQFGDGRIFLLQSDRRAGHAHLGEAGADGVLPADEACAAGRAALLRVVVGEGHPLFRDPVDVRGLIAHHAATEMADVPDADVVAPEDEDIGFVRLCHVLLLSVSGRLRPRLASWRLEHERHALRDVVQEDLRSFLPGAIAIVLSRLRHARCSGSRGGRSTCPPAAPCARPVDNAGSSSARRDTTRPSSPCAGP